MNLLLMSSSVVGAAIAAIAESFPDEAITKVQMLSTIPQLGQLVATLLFTWLTYILTRKNVGLLAVGFVMVSGLLPVFFNSSLNIILACMVALGFGIGLISNVGPVLLQEHFDGEERASVMGWAVGVNNIGMMAFTGIGGVLGGVDWRNLFWIYGIAVIIFILVFFLVPQDVRSQGLEKKTQQSFMQSVKGLSGYVYIIIGITFIMSLGLMTFMANQSLLLAGKGYGTAYTAMVSAIGNVGGILTAFSLKYIRKMTKTDTIAWGFVAFALSYVCIAFFDNISLHILGNMFSGVGIVMVNATIPYELSILADHKQFPVVIAMNTLMSSVAGVLSPIILAAIGVTAGQQSFIAGMIICSVTAVVLLITRLGSRVEKIHQTKVIAEKA
ncbi:MFS transporter [Candidatus Enterococcus huntleyi]|uniref:MFS transporter n=1 Tax=Candidatus Enterococcus huntleyi TaxID=1857217 RepID=UPI001EFFA9C2|nr:MFS transporter [Enterococcus sp. JM4C]